MKNESQEIGGKLDTQAGRKVVSNHLPNPYLSNY